MRGSVSWLLFVTLSVLVSTIIAASKDYYSILDVPRDAQKIQIKRHFKKLSRVYHPDKNSGDEVASQKFMEIANGRNRSSRQKNSKFDVILNCSL
jgi:DnaJ-related protein SCJ1